MIHLICDREHCGSIVELTDPYELVRHDELNLPMGWFRAREDGKLYCDRHVEKLYPARYVVTDKGAQYDEEKEAK